MYRYITLPCLGAASFSRVHPDLRSASWAKHSGRINICVRHYLPSFPFWFHYYMPCSHLLHYPALHYCILVTLSYTQLNTASPPPWRGSQNIQYLSPVPAPRPILFLLRTVISRTKSCLGKVPILVLVLSSSLLYTSLSCSTKLSAHTLQFNTKVLSTTCCNCSLIMAWDESLEKYG